MKITIKIAGEQKNIDVESEKILIAGCQTYLLEGLEEGKEVYWIENIKGEPIEDSLFSSFAEAEEEFNKY